MSALPDLLDPALHAREDVWLIFARVRELGPVVWTPGRRSNGYWSVVGHPELIAVARDPFIFSSWWGTRPEVRRPDGAERPLHNLDPPSHAVVRAIALRCVSAKQLDSLGRFVDSVIKTALDEALARRSLDGHRELAEPIAAQVFTRFLGLPTALSEHLLARVAAVHTAGARLIDATKTDPDRPTKAADAQHATSALHATLADALSVDAPHGSVLQVLGEARAARELASTAAVGLAALLVEAGLPTLVDGLTAILEAAALHPTLVEGLADRPRDRALILEEMLRLASPIVQFARRARTTTRLGGKTIAEGQQVVLWFGAANRDPRVFAEPDKLRADRAPNPHVSFGVGPHHCLGATLARRTLSLFFHRLCERVARVERDGTWVRRASSYQRGFDALPLQLYATSDARRAW